VVKGRWLYFDDDEKEMDILENEEEQEGDEMVEECTDECWVMVGKLQLQSPVP
jgi:hypothetical protein